jgi:hypothetical protein
MKQCSRKPATAILLGVFALSAFYLCQGKAAARSADGPTLAQLEVAIADPDAGTDTWMLYAQRLQKEKRFSHAAMAYERVLETDPYSRTANIGCATALALEGDPDRFFIFVNSLMLIEPRLILDVFGRPESAPFLTRENFKTLHAQAQVQSLD